MNLKNFLYPKTVAVIGASADRKKIGNQILRNLIDNGFKGKIYPINTKEKSVEKIKAFSSITLIRDKVDLVIISIPAEHVFSEIEKCAHLGLKNIIIISAGFNEIGGVGKLRELKLKEYAKKHQLNVLGPNCFGIINTEINLNATFAKPKNKKGNIAFISQSGAICSAVLDWSQDKNLGFSKFISLGNKSGIDENDLFDYFVKDKKTDFIVAYLEEVKDGQRFIETVAKLSKVKPVAILKSGLSEAGAEAAISHTGSLAGSSVSFQAGLKRSGAISLGNLEEMFDLLAFYAHKKKLKNNKLAIISNAGGPLVVTIDSLADAGIGLTDFSSGLKKDLQKILPPTVTVRNPLDLIGDADARRYEVALEKVLTSSDCGAILVLLTPQTSTEIEKTAEVIIGLSKKHKDKLILTSFMGGKEVKSARKIFEENNIINFDYPNKAVNVLKKIFNYETAKKNITEFRGVAGFVKDTNLKQLDFIASIELLKKYKIPFVNTHKIKNEKDLEKIEFPIVLKAVGDDFIHKTEKKAVEIGVKDIKGIADFTNRFKSEFDRGSNYLVFQEMVGGGIEMILGFKRDKSFGPIIMVGMGGIYAEIFKDVNFGVGLIKEQEAIEMIKGLKVYEILKGARGHAGYDIKSLAKAIVAVSKLAQENKAIQELDINPIFIKHKGVVAVDVRMVK